MPVGVAAGKCRGDESPWWPARALGTIPRFPAGAGRQLDAVPGPRLSSRADPMTTLAEILRMSSADKIAEAMHRSLPFVPASARSTVEAMLRPEALAIVVGTLAVWAGSHFIGIGEIVDVILLTVGVVTLGFAVFEGAEELCQFAKGAMAARTDAELDEAGRHFARAVTLLGISTIQAVLLRGQGRALLARGRPQVLPRINPGSPPPAGNQLRLSRHGRLSGGDAGRDGRVWRDLGGAQPATERAAAHAAA